MIFWHFADAAHCEKSLMLAQKCKTRISEFWPKLVFLLEQQIKSILTLLHLKKIVLYITIEYGGK